MQYSSWTRHVEQSIGIITDLADHDLTVFVAPLQRLMIEHGISASMLARDTDTWEVFLREATHGAMRLRVSTGNYVVPGLEGIDSFIEAGLTEESQPNKRFRKIKERFEDIGDSGRRLYILWLESTQVSHAGVPTAYV